MPEDKSESYEHIVERANTLMKYGDDGKFLKVLRYIDNNVLLPQTVEKIANGTGLSTSLIKFYIKNLDSDDVFKVNSDGLVSLGFTAYAILKKYPENGQK